MPYRDPAAYGFVMRVVLPPVLGALGALLATMAPSYYEAICTSPMVPLHAVSP